jgi:hypothetical protein
MPYYGWIYAGVLSERRGIRMSECGCSRVSEIWKLTFEGLFALCCPFLVIALAFLVGIRIFEHSSILIGYQFYYPAVLPCITSVHHLDLSYVSSVYVLGSVSLSCLYCVLISLPVYSMGVPLWLSVFVHGPTFHVSQSSSVSVWSSLTHHPLCRRCSAPTRIR